MLATRTEIIVKSRHDCHCLQEVTCKKTDPYLALNPSSFPVTETLCLQTSRSSRTLKGFGNGGLQIAEAGKSFMFLPLEFDDCFNGTY